MSESALTPGSGPCSRRYAATASGLDGYNSASGYISAIPKPMTRHSGSAVTPRPISASTSSTAESTETSRLSPVRRSRISTTPSTSPRPTTTEVGIPSTSASANFTPGRRLPVIQQYADAPGPPAPRRSRWPWPGPLRPCRWPVPARRRGGPASAARPGPSRRRSPRPPPPRPGRPPRSRRTHGDRGLLAVLVQHLQPERVGVLATELENVTHLNPAGQLQFAGAVGSRVAGADLGDIDQPVGGEVPATDQIDHVLAGLVRTGHPGGALPHPRIDQVPDPARIGGGPPLGDLSQAQRTRAEVALDQIRVLLEVSLGERLDRGRLDVGLQALRLDLAITGQADRQRFPGAIGMAQHHQHVLQRVGRGPGTIGRGCRWFSSVTRASMVGVSGVSTTRAAGASS